MTTTPLSFFRHDGGGADANDDNYGGYEDDGSMHMQTRHMKGQGRHSLNSVDAQDLAGSRVATVHTHM